MTSEFGQFCPIALASEVLAQKWMFLIIRELNAGSTRFNEIRRGVPRISATLLKQRLDQLEQVGVIIRRRNEKGSSEEYLLTEAGRELKAVLGSVGEWGQRWARAIEKDDLDPGWLVWAMHRRIDVTAMPLGRTVLEFEFFDAPKDQRLFWFLCANDSVDVCIKSPGFDTDLKVITSVQVFAEVWRGLRPLRQEIKSGGIRLEGSLALQRAFPGWLLLSVFAKTRRQV